jgi:hypothetical protein
VKKREQQLASKKAWIHNNSLFFLLPKTFRSPEKPSQKHRSQTAFSPRFVHENAYSV